MKILRLIGPCVAVAALVSAATSAGASAFAPPEIGRCVKVAAGAGKFASATCTKEKKAGSYEWLPGAEKKKFATTGGLGTLATVVGTTVTCKTEDSGGEFNSSKTVAGVVVRFTSCESAGFNCATAGAKEGEIVTNSLEGRIGIEKRAFVEGKEVPLKNKIAFDLFPTAADGGLYVTFNCGSSLHITVGGSVLVPIKAANKMLSTLELKYSAKGGHQKPEHFEGEPNDVLISEINEKKPEQSGITISTKQTAEEPLEVNTVF